MLCGPKKAQKSFPPKLNWKTLANCVDKYLNSQTETIESELPTCEFGYGKYLFVSFWYASAAYQARLVSPTMARPNSPDMPPKGTKKVPLGIITITVTLGRIRSISLILGDMLLGV